jgi:hypothetical protein
MMRLLAWGWSGLKVAHASLGVKRELVALFVLLLPLVFHGYVHDYLAARGVRDWPVVQGAWPAVVLVSGYLYWRLLRHAVLFEYGARASLTARLLDPGQRYDTYVALGNRVLRLYHLEVENASRFGTARDVGATLLDYRKTGDAKVVDIRSRPKVANSETEKLDLNPGARVAFELCAIEVNGAGTGSSASATDERDSQTFSILPAGSGTIRVVVDAYDAPPWEEQYRVYIDSSGAMTIKPQNGIQ